MRRLLPLVLFAACQSPATQSDAMPSVTVTNSGLRRVRVYVDRLE